MNLHGIAAGAISAVNPFVDALLMISAGYDTAPSGQRTPRYATPGQFSGFIADGVLYVSNVISGGPLMIGQTIIAAGVLPGTVIDAFIDGNGGEGSYAVLPQQTVTSDTILQQGGQLFPQNPYFDFSTSFNVSAQVQPLSYKDIEHVDSLNIGGYRRAIYISGRLDALVRMNQKGGDLVILADGTVWLVATVLEQWPDWVKVAATLQNGAAGQFGAGFQSQPGLPG